MDYYYDSVVKKPDERAWVTYIKSKVTEENNSFPCMVVGKTGSGKSYGTIRLCQEIDPDFELDGNWFFRADKFMKAFTEYYKGNPKPGKLWILDEAGIDLNSLKYQGIINKAYSSLFQTARFRNYIFFGTVPFFHFISKQTRLLMQYRMIGNGVHNGTKTILVPRCISYSDDGEKEYKRKLTCICDDGEERKINRILLPKAKKSILVEYEKRKSEFSNTLNEELMNEMMDFFGKNDKSNKAPLPEKYQILIDMYKKNQNQDNIAVKLDMSVARIKKMVQVLKKQGWGFNQSKEGHTLFDPEVGKWQLYPKEKV